MGLSSHDSDGSPWSNIVDNETICFQSSDHLSDDFAFMVGTAGHLAGDWLDLSCVNMEDKSSDVLALTIGGKNIQTVLCSLSAVFLEFIGDIGELDVLLNFWKVGFQMLDDIIAWRKFFALLHE